MRFTSCGNSSMAELGNFYFPTFENVIFNLDTKIKKEEFELVEGP